MIRSYQRCKRQYDYKFVQGLVPKRTGLPLKRGSWLHELLEAKYTTGGWRAKHEELSTEFMRLFEEEREYYGDLPAICEHLMESYDFYYRVEDEDLRWYSIEKDYEVEMPHGHTLRFRIDGLVEDSWGIWLAEHKSHKTLPEDDYRFIDMQTARYVWGVQKVEGIELTGVLWNYICTTEPKKPKILKSGALSSRKIRTDLFTFVTTLRENDLDPRDYRDDILRLKHHNEFFMRQRVPKPKKVIETLVKDAIITADEIERGFSPVRSIDRSCSYMCPFLNLCITDLYGGDSREIIETQYRKGDEKDYYIYADEQAKS